MNRRDDEHLTAYEQWQVKNFGNVLPGSKDEPDECEACTNLAAANFYFEMERFFNQ
jgi:hypothetical protein